MSISPERLKRHWSELCQRIGERRAGSAGDYAASDYVLDQFRRASLSQVHAETFPCVTVAQARAEVAIGAGQNLKSIEARVLAGSPATPRGKMVEGKLVWIEMPEQADRFLRRSLKGKIVVLVGPMPTRADLHRRLVASAPAVVIHVDDRLPFAWVKDDGVYPVWVRRFGMPPTITIPYQSAWELRKASANRAHARVEVRLEQTTSNNVIGEIAGRRPDLPLIVLSAHHDTQCNNTGADDNASGVVALLELATLFATARPLRTIRLISFGAEEQLSVGSAAYAAAHRREMESIGAVFNLDSVTSPLGHHWMLRAGSDAFAGTIVRILAEHGLDVIDKPAPIPFADHFPFSIFGVPAVTFLRPNMDSGMRWQHHSAQDNLENVSVAELSRVVGALEGLVKALADKPRWPFGHGLAPAQVAETARLGRELFNLRAK
jgi:Peptidase family M28